MNEMRDLKREIAQLKASRFGEEPRSYNDTSRGRGGRGRGARGGGADFRNAPHGDKTYQQKLDQTCSAFNSGGCSAPSDGPGFCKENGQRKKHACSKRGQGESICWMRHSLQEHR